MTTYRDRLVLPYPRQQVFDLVADIESYPLFVPHIADARVRRRDGNEWLVDQVLQFRMFSLPFSTRARLEPPSHIHIACDDARLGHFVEDWRFEDAPHGGTVLTCVTAFQARSGLVDRILGIAAADMHRMTMRAFAARAHALFKDKPIHARSAQ